MQKLILVVAVPLTFLCVLVAVEFPMFGWLGLAAPVAMFTWLVLRMRHAPAPPGFERPLVVPPAEAGDDDVVDAIFDDGTQAGTAPSDSLTTVARYQFAIDAQLARNRLEAEGIPAFLANEHTTQALGFYRTAHGGVGVMVATAQAAAAAQVLQALAAGAYALEDKAPPATPA